MINRRGVSIVEVVVALVVFSVAALGSAGALVIASRAQQNASARREALSAIEARADSLSLVACAGLRNGQRVTSGVTVQWTVAPSDSIARITLLAMHRGTRTTLSTESACE